MQATGATRWIPVPDEDAETVFDQMRTTIDELAKRYHEEDMLQLNIGVQTMVSETGVNERTLRQNGYPKALSREYDHIEYVPYKGLRVTIEPYLEERGLLKTPENG